VGPDGLLGLEVSQPRLELLVLQPQQVVLAAQLVQLVLQVGHVLLLLLARQASRFAILDHSLLTLESLHLHKIRLGELKSWQPNRRKGLIELAKH